MVGHAGRYRRARFEFAPGSKDVTVLELRRYEERDAASVWRLHDHGLRQMGVHAGDGPWDDDLRFIAATYLSGGGEFLVAAIAGEVVAMGALRRVSPTVAEVKRMRVDARFQRRGFGRAVLQGLEARARELGYRTLRLDTTVQQLPAQFLYRADGFVEVERVGETAIVFEKRLA